MIGAACDLCRSFPAEFQKDATNKTKQAINQVYIFFFFIYLQVLYGSNIWKSTCG